jgi:hypothetical protein
LSGVKEKIAQIDATLRRKGGATKLGMPRFTETAGRATPAKDLS